MVRPDGHRKGRQRLGIVSARRTAHVDVDETGSGNAHVRRKGQPEPVRSGPRHLSRHHGGRDGRRDGARPPRRCGWPCGRAAPGCRHAERGRARGGGRGPLGPPAGARAIRDGAAILRRARGRGGRRARTGTDDGGRGGEPAAQPHAGGGEPARECPRPRHWHAGQAGRLPRAQPAGGSAPGGGFRRACRGTHPDRRLDRDGRERLLLRRRTRSDISAGSSRRRSSRR